MYDENELAYQILSGPEIETLTDYWGQGMLGVSYYTGYAKNKRQFHSLPKAYDNMIAVSEDPNSRLSMSTDCNRSGNGNVFPLRIGIEFRANPGKKPTEKLLHLVETYHIWLTQKKEELKRTKYKNYNNPSRNEKRCHDVLLTEFIDYYNRLDATEEKLNIQSPKKACDPRNSFLEFRFDFPEDAEWVLRLDHEDLNATYRPAFYTQYNLSIPIGFVFDPNTKNAFGLQSEFALLLNEKEFAADFNESRPHIKFLDYEQRMFQSSVELADQFFHDIKAPDCAFGIRDFLRGMAYEISMISTSKTYLTELFQDDALWTLQRLRESELSMKDEVGTSFSEANKSHKIAENISDTLKKSIFPYFMKATLATFFKQLHPYEKSLLRGIAKNQVREFCRSAVMFANGGKGNDDKNHSSHVIIRGRCFMDKFDDFYQETFKGATVPEGFILNDPIGWLSARLIDPVNISLSRCPIKSIVVEVRMPKQGNQEYPAIATLCDQYPQQLEQLLATQVPHITDCRNQLNELWQVQQSTKSGEFSSNRTKKPVNSYVLGSNPVHSLGLFKAHTSSTASKSTTKKPVKKQNTSLPNKSEQKYDDDFLWSKPKSYKRVFDDNPVSSHTRQSNLRPRVR